MITKLLQAVQAHIMTATLEDGTFAINTCALFANQPMYWTEQDTVRLPAAYVQVYESDWDSLGRNIQDGSVMLRIHVATRSLKSTELVRLHNGSIDKPKPGAYDPWLVVEAVHRALQGWEPECDCGCEDCPPAGKMNRERLQQDDNAAVLVVHQADYRVQVQDCQTDTLLPYTRVSAAHAARRVQVGADEKAPEPPEPETGGFIVRTRRTVL